MISCCIIFNMDVTVTWPNTSAKIIMFLRARIDVACGHSALCLFCCFNTPLHIRWKVIPNLNLALVRIGTPCSGWGLYGSHPLLWALRSIENNIKKFPEPLASIIRRLMPTPVSRSGLNRVAGPNRIWFQSVGKGITLCFVLIDTTLNGWYLVGWHFFTLGY